jgi:hypothetical protein
MVQGVRFELPEIGDVSPLIYFFAESFPPFSLLGCFACRVTLGLAEDEKNESTNSQLPSLRQDHIGRGLEREVCCYFGNDQLSLLRQQEALERRKKENSFRRNSTLSLSRLRSSFFAVLSCSSLNSSLFFKICLRFSRRIGFEDLQ